MTANEHGTPGDIGICQLGNRGALAGRLKTLHMWGADALRSLPEEVCSDVRMHDTGCNTGSITVDVSFVFMCRYHASWTS